MIKKSIVVALLAACSVSSVVHATPEITIKDGLHRSMLDKQNTVGELADDIAVNMAVCESPSQQMSSQIHMQADNAKPSELIGLYSSYMLSNMAVWFYGKDEIKPVSLNELTANIGKHGMFAQGYLATDTARSTFTVKPKPNLLLEKGGEYIVKTSPLNCGTVTKNPVNLEKLVKDTKTSLPSFRFFEEMGAYNWEYKGKDATKFQEEVATVLNKVFFEGKIQPMANTVIGINSKKAEATFMLKYLYGKYTNINVMAYLVHQKEQNQYIGYVTYAPMGKFVRGSATPMIKQMAAMLHSAQ